MTNPFSLKKILLLGLLIFTTVTGKAEITAVHFGIDGVTGLQLISPLDTTIGPKILDDTQYHLITSTNTDFKFIRHVVSRAEEICYYWFRDNQDPSIWTDTEAYSDSYWYVGGSTCEFVDGAQDGDNNFVLLRDTQKGLLVGVLQYRLNSSDDQNNPARLLAYAVDPNGLTYSDAIAAIHAIPEPTSVALLGVAAAGALVILRRRR